jgi:hypothetical protein
MHFAGTLSKCVVVRGTNHGGRTVDINGVPVLLVGVRSRVSQLAIGTSRRDGNCNDAQGEQRQAVR